MQLTVSLKVDVPATTSIPDLELVIQEAGQQAMRMALCQAVRAYEAQHQTCPYCGNPLVQGEGTDRRVLRTLFGRVVLAPRRLRCQGCRRRFRPAPGEAPVEALEAALTYLETQRGWIGNYQHWREMGYPVGSGLVERAVALIINRRLKRQGMRWRRANATAVVALRVRAINADWEAASAQRHWAA